MVKRNSFEEIAKEFGQMKYKRDNTIKDGTIEWTIRDGNNTKVWWDKCNLQDKKIYYHKKAIIEHKFDLLNEEDKKDKQEEPSWIDMENEFFK